MVYITTIMSGLALLAAVLCLFLLRQEKKRNQKRNADMVNYIDAEIRVVEDDICQKEEGWVKKFDKLLETIQQKSIEIDKLSTKIENLVTKVDKLEQGIIPDYQEALAAKNSVDEFNRGLSAIMGYDPMEIARKAREERHYGGEVD